MSAPTFRWTDAEVRRALGLDLPHAEGVAYGRVSTDSRTTEEGDLYVALAGPRFDGHDFLPQALAAGARGAVVSRAVEAGGEAPLYQVDDTLVALGRLATWRRRALPARVVGITGSSGKTGTKDLTAAALASTLAVHATRGNLNNRVGVPQTLLSASPGADVLVVEMGTNEPGEIATLAAIALPDVAVVTTVGESHLEKLGSLEGVLKEKLSLVEALGDEGAALVGDTPPFLPDAARRLRPGVRVAGWSERADPDLRPEAVTVGPSGAHEFTWRGARVRLAMPGRHHVGNALLALGVAETLGVETAAAAAALADAGPGWMRGEVRSLARITLLLDCYNANPQSVASALDLLEAQAAGDRVAVLGSMLELGPESDALHERVLADALRRDLRLVVAVGSFARAASRVGGARGGAELVTTGEPEEAYRLLRERLQGGEVVLLKASRGVALERLVPSFERDFGSREPTGESAPPGEG